MGRPQARRRVDPTRTLARIRPHLGTIGVTRCADVTGLDTVGVPAYRAVRPRGLTVQVTGGSAARAVDAQVDALLSAIAVHHAEHPAPGSLRRRSERALRREAVEVLDPALLPGFRAAAFYSPDYEIDWLPGTDLSTGEPTWLPASAVHLCWPALYPFHRGGLAGGDDVRDATLRALYGLLERDAVGRLDPLGGPASVEGCAVIDPATITDPLLTGLRAALERAGLKLVLLSVPSRADVTVCWAAILVPRPPAGPSTVTFGFGAHLSPSAAAARAVTQAIGARLTSVHGSADDSGGDLARGWVTRERLHGSFDRLRPTRRWADLADRSTPGPVTDLELVLSALARDGYGRVLRVDLTRPPCDIPVVKLLVPGLPLVAGRGAD